MLKTFVSVCELMLLNNNDKWHLIYQPPSIINHTSIAGLDTGSTQPCGQGDLLFQLPGFGVHSQTVLTVFGGPWVLRLPDLLENYLA